MIVCTRCGRENDESARICVRCGHKLQSGRSGATADPDRQWRPLDPMGVRREGLGGLLGRMVSVLALAGLLVAAVLYGLTTRSWWPSLAVGAAAAGYLLLRRD